MRDKPLSHKTNGLPVGITQTWRVRRGSHERNRSPYLEFQVLYKDEAGNRRIKHFYVGTEPGPHLRELVLRKAIEFRKAYEDRVRLAEQA